MTEIKLGLSMFRMGYHIAAWRHPDVPADGSMDFRHFLSVTQAAERGNFDLVFMADELAIRGRDNPPGALVRQSNGAELEPITLLAALAPMTRHIGLVSTGSTTYSEPFNLARQFLSLDHLSGGRASITTRDKRHVLDHKGKYFSVRGPLHLARSPQDEPVIFCAGDSEAGREIAAKCADVVFTTKQDLDGARAFYASLAVSF
jgi:alkanesulfonate monooxygenase SsuD/methylene tetrahydromethanopterin reductase-like flavin-dependent oxidoreductase (luciferase family)